MKPMLPRLATAAFAGGVLCLAACSRQPARHEPPPAQPRPAAAPAHARHAPRHVATPASAPLPASTGIPACDAYLSTYIACHRAAGIFPPDQLQSRYEMMRDSLLRDSRDPDTRPQLANRCTSLSESLHQALHGKSCNAPLPAGADGP